MVQKNIKIHRKNTISLALFNNVPISPANLPHLLTWQSNPEEIAGYYTKVIHFLKSKYPSPPSNTSWPLSVKCEGKELFS